MLHKFCAWTHLSTFDQSEHNVERDQRVTLVRKVKSNFPVCKSWLNSRVRGQFEIKSLVVRLINTTPYFLCVKKIELEPAIIWKVVACQWITSKKLNLVGRYLSPGYGQVMMVSGCCSLTAINWLNFIRMANFRINWLLTTTVSKTFQSGRSCIWAYVVSDLIVVLQAWSFRPFRPDFCLFGRLRNKQ